MRIFGWVADYGGCCYYRMRLPLDVLHAQGKHHATWHGDMPPQDFAEADTIIGQRVCLPGPSKTWRLLSSRKRARLVYEIDDNLFEVDPSSTGPYGFFQQPEIRDNLIRNICCANAVTVSTHPLAEVVRRYNPNVVVVPNRIPAWLLDHERPRSNRLTIGWAGSPTHVMDMEEAGPQISRFIRRNPDVEHHVIGAAFKYVERIPSKQYRHTKWTKSVEDYLRSIDFDIALAPLKPHVFNRSKSEIKFLEYAALGIPTIASDVGPYARSIRHGETGFLVKRPHEWGQYLRLLTEDDALRRKMGDAAKSWARENTVEGNLSHWTRVWGIQ